METLWSGFLLKVGNSNNTWKKRFFRVLVPSLHSEQKPRIEYFEDAPKPGKQAGAPRGEMLVTDIIGVCLLMAKGTVPPQLEAFVDQSADYTHQGPPKLFIVTRTVLWRLGFSSAAAVAASSSIASSSSSSINPSGNPNAISLSAASTGGGGGDSDEIQFLPCLQRASTRLSRISVRLSGWMQSQGTLSWNRRFALLLSSGDLLLFRDASLTHLRRRITLGEAHGIRPVHPLAPSGSASERRVVRVLEAKDQGTDLVPGVDGYELVSVCIRHPDIQERQGYVMSVEAVPGDDAFQHYARFRRWVMLLQLTASDARLASSGLSVATLSPTPPPQALHHSTPSGGAGGTPPSASSTSLLFSSREANDAQKQLRLIAESGRARSMVLAQHLASSGFPTELRGALWAACSGAAFLRSSSSSSSSNMNTSGSTGLPSYASLLEAAVGGAASTKKQLLAGDRLVQAMARWDPGIQLSVGLERMMAVVLLEQGEETAFWTLVALVGGHEPGSALLPGFFHRRGGAYALYVEANVVLDILGLTLPDLVAHMSAYDWLDTARRSIAQWIGSAGCFRAAEGGVRYPRRVWDVMSVIGRDALVGGCVAILASRKSSLMQAYSREDAERILAGEVLSGSLGNASEDSDVLSDPLADEAFSGVRATEAAAQARRAQWAMLVDVMQTHFTLSRTWLGICDAAQTLCEEAVGEANRLRLPRIHSACLGVARAYSALRRRSQALHSALQREIARASPFAQFADPRSGTRAQEGRLVVWSPPPPPPPQAGGLLKEEEEEEEEEEDSPSSAGEDLLLALRQVAWVACAEAWSAWLALQRLVWTKLRFCCTCAAPLGSSSSAVAMPLEQIVAAGGAGAAAAAAIGETGLEGGVAASLDDDNAEEPDEPEGTFSRLTRGLGRWQRRLLRAEDAPPLLTRSTSLSWQLGYESREARLLGKFRGGLVGLIDVAGGPAQVALLKHAILADAEVQRLLDRLEGTTQLARHCEQLAARIETTAATPRRLDLPLLRGVFSVSAAAAGEGPRLSAAIDELLARLS